MFKKSASSTESVASKKPFYKRPWFIAIAVVLVLGMLGSGSDGESSQGESSQGNDGGEQLSVEFAAVTKYLEYSDKEVDPVSLVEVDAEDAVVSTDDEIDLKTVGVQTVTYTIALDGKKATQEVEFTVRDTKAPTIKLAVENPSIELGGSYDFSAAVSSVEDEVDGALGFLDAAPEAKGEIAGTEVFYDQGWCVFEGIVDSATPGSYPIKVVAADRHGNVSSKEFVVTVKEPVYEEAVAQTPAAATYTYVVNNSSMKFHIKSCSAAKKIKDSNRGEITATRDEMISWGYSPCGTCKP